MKIYSNKQPMFDDWVLFLENSNNLPQTNFPVCVGWKSCKEPYIIFNTEQTTRKDFNFWRFTDSDIIEVWDYSLENIKNFKKNGIYNVKHVPFCLWDDYKRKIESYNVTKNYEYDVVFVGWINERRDLILNKLKQNGIKVLTIHYDLFGEERYKMISKSKILLNIHFTEDYNIFESYRCFPWIETNKIIVSENSLDNDIRCVNVDYENIVDTIIKIINNN
jgi:hypothetical protein